MTDNTHIFTPLVRARRASARLPAAGLLALLCVALVAPTAHAEPDTFQLGNGSDGALNVNGGGDTIINTYARVTAAVPAGQNFVNVTSTAGFLVDDLVLVFQGTGLTGTVTSGSQTAVDLTGNPVGRWQFARVASLTATRLTFTNPLTVSFGATGTQAIRVPEYTTVTVGTNGRIVARAWDGSTGGVVIFLATGAVSVGGTISASERGFRGGLVMDDGSGDACVGIDEPWPGGANKGEGVVPSTYNDDPDPASIPPPGTTGFGNIVNGAGGGICHNSGGGGGSSAGAGGRGGRTWGGEAAPSRDVGGLGGTQMRFDPLDHVLFGGGGGAGHGNNFLSGAGGAGGGIVFIRAASLTGTGTIAADGQQGLNARGGGNDAAGGGGAGGTLSLRFTGTLACDSGLRLSARGGNGGSTAFAEHGPGGGGGGGRVLIQGGTVSCTPTVPGGTPGQQPLASAPGGLTYGAVAGSVGVITTLAGPFPTVPAAPVVTTPANGSTTGPRPAISGTAPAGSTVIIFIDGLEVGRATADAAGNFTFTPATDLALGSRNVSAIAEVQGVASPRSNTNNFTVGADTTPPETTIVSGPPAVTNSTSATFAFSSNESPVTYECSLDGGAFAACANPRTFTSLAEGNHTLAVRARDAANNVDATPATYAWRVDITAPDTTIVSGPPAVTNSTSATFDFSSPESPVTYQCSLDGGAFTACTDPVTFTGLAQGSHTLAVRAVDAAGNVDASPATRTWVVDTTPPDTTIVSGPPAVTSSTTATFDFSSPESPVTYECSLDGGAFAACIDPQSFSVAQGSHTLAVRARDAAGNVDPSPATYAWTVDTTAPDTTIVSGPPALTNSSSATFDFSSNESPVTYQCSLDGGAFVACTDPRTFTGLADGNHTLAVRAVDAAGNVDASPATRAWAVDTVPPDTTIVSGPPTVTNSTSATFDFSSNDAAATYECSLDGGAFTACTDPRTFTGLANGNHTLAVRARDAAGNVDPTPATYAWTVDTTAPDTTIVSGPSGVTASTSATFDFSSNESPVTYECSLDGGAFAACTDPVTFNGLAQGGHTLAVRARDAAGNVDPTPATRAWTVDTVAPDTSFASTPPLVSNSAVATFDFSSNEAGVTYECRLDGAVLFTPCADPQSFPGLANGGHSLQVRAVDAAGNVDPTPAVYTWTVDTVAPDTTIVSGPPAVTSSTSATFDFSSPESPVTYECSLDGGAFAACTDPVTFTGLADGNHTLAVRAVDAAGNVDSTPATRTWTVDTTAPDTTIVSGPPTVTSSTAATFDFSSNEAGVTYECRLDGAVLFTACSDPQTFPGLTDGNHALLVRARDAAGNVDPTPASYVWTVDTVTPDTIILSGPPALTNSSSATFDFSSNENPVTYQCSLDGGAFVACTDPRTFTGLADGNHTLAVRAVDAAGNVDPSPATYTWTVDTTPPNTLIVSGPPPVTNATTATFDLDSDTANATYQCSLNGAPFVACADPATFSGLVERSYTLAVRAVDAAGNVDPSPATYTWTVDLTAPEAPVITAPANGSVVPTRRPTFAGTAEPGTVVTVVVDGVVLGTAPVDGSGNWTFPCPVDLEQDSHTVVVTSTDAAGNVSEPSAPSTFRVDTVAPAAPLITRPEDGATVATRRPTYQGTAEPGAQVTVEVDGRVVGTVTADMDGRWSLPETQDLPDGAHTVEATATDSAGNVSEATSHDFFVDTTAPDTLIVSGPALRTNSTSATFDFDQVNGGVSYQCSLDGAPFVACTDPVTFSGLMEGNHTLAVRAVNAFGTVDPDPATYAWAVDLTRPAPPTITAPGDGETVGTATPSLTGTGEVGSSIFLELGNATYGPIPVGADGTWSFTVPVPLPEGPYTVSATSVDGAGNTAGPVTSTFTVDLTGPNTLIVSGPAAITRETSATFDFDQEGGGVAYQCSVDGAPFAPCTDPVTFNGFADGEHMLRVRAVDAVGNVDPTPAEYTWAVDATAPDTLIDSGPADPTNATSATFEFSASEPGSTYECSVDGAAFVPCTDPVTFNGFAEGEHQLLVRAVDAAGNVDPTPAEYTWTVDLTAPVAPVIVTPANGAVLDSGTVTLTGTAEGATSVTLTLGGTTYGPIPVDAQGNWTFTPPVSLGDGPYTVSVVAVDAAGNTSAPATSTFTVDTTAPDTAIDSGPAALTRETTASFVFSSNESPVTYECSLDGAAFEPCPFNASFGPLTDGDHSLAVRAVDAAGNVDATPATRTWTVDTVAPAVTLATPPSGAVLANNVVTYSGTAEPDSTVTVVVDGVVVGTATADGAGNWTLTPATPLAEGPHSVTVTATDPAGNTSQPVTHPFSVDALPPDTSFTVTPPALANSATATFEFTSDESPVSYECSLDGAAFTPCLTPLSLSGLTEGEHTLAVRARDADNNEDPTPAEYTWTVDTTAPDTSIVSGPPLIDAPTTATFDFDSTGGGVGYQCSLDGAAFGPCPDPVTFTDLAPGAHTLLVRAVDAAGNVDPTPATYTWSVTVDTDGDGLSDAQEGTLGTDPNDPDSDDDGVTDGIEVNVGGTDPLDDDSDDDGLLDGTEDADRDGIVDATETDPDNADTDGDLLADGLELGLTEPQGGDTDMARFTPDADPSTRTNPLNVDTDSGSVRDGVEDANHNGRVDAGETDPNVAADDIDSDLDGVDDVTEIELGTDPRDADTDDDGVQDGQDGLTDTDGDGLIDARDPDSDNDGLLDGTERGVTVQNAPVGTNTSSPNFRPDDDPSTTTDPRRADTDGDGLDDGVEDGDRNGRVGATETDPRRADTDDDGLSDGVEVRGSNATNPLDADSDDDGLRDGAEDANRNGGLDSGETDPNNADTDLGGASDGEEVNGGGNPLDGNDDFIVVGRGCSTGGAGTFAPLAMLLLALPLLGRLRRAGGRPSRALVAGAAGGLVLTGSLVAAPARAQVTAPTASQAIDVQRYKPGPGAGDILGVYGARVQRHLGWNVGLSLNYADKPLNFLDPRQDRFITALVRSQVGLDLMGAVGLFDRVELGVLLPVTLQDSDPAPQVDPSFAQGVGSGGIGDLRVVPKARLVDGDDFDLALVVPVVLPTGGEADFLGGSGVGLQPRVVAEYGQRLRLAANLGMDFRSKQQLRNLRTGNALAFGVGAEVPFTVGELPLAAAATLVGGLGFEEQDAEERPLELLAALKYRAVSGLSAHVGAGPGLTRGYGTPGFRVLAGLSYSPEPSREPKAAPPPPPPADTDGDGRVDGQDACPTEAEDPDGFEDANGCPDPDNDQDGILDGADRCVSEPETKNGHEDADGCPDTEPAPVDTDGDGLVDPKDGCPKVPEDADGFEDADGCPELDNDKDGIVDTADRCPSEPEVINGVKDEDGCPDKGKVKVQVDGERILILEKVYFATSKDVILARSFPLLKQVAAVLRANPQVELLRIEGHTDDQGNDAKNLDLSRRRAANVRAFLVKEGIAAERLVSEGYGETKPVDTNKTAKGRENNRRVEFTILRVGKVEVEREAP